MAFIHILFVSNALLSAAQAVKCAKILVCTESTAAPCTSGCLHAARVPSPLNPQGIAPRCAADCDLSVVTVFAARGNLTRELGRGSGPVCVGEAGTVSCVSRMNE